MKRKTFLYSGGLLILLGGLLLLPAFGLGVRVAGLWPLVLVVAGLLLLFDAKESASWAFPVVIITMVIGFWFYGIGDVQPHVSAEYLQNLPKVFH